MGIAGFLVVDNNKEKFQCPLSPLKSLQQHSESEVEAFDTGKLWNSSSW